MVYALRVVLVLDGVIPLQLPLFLQVLGQGLFPGPGPQKHPLKALQLQLQVVDRVVGLGE